MHGILIWNHESRTIDSKQVHVVVYDTVWFVSVNVIQQTSYTEKCLNLNHRQRLKCSFKMTFDSVLSLLRMINIGAIVKDHISTLHDSISAFYCLTPHCKAIKVLVADHDSVKFIAHISCDSYVKLKETPTIRMIKAERCYMHILNIVQISWYWMRVFFVTFDTFFSVT